MLFWHFTLSQYQKLFYILVSIPNSYWTETQICCCCLNRSIQKHGGDIKQLNIPGLVCSEHAQLVFPAFMPTCFICRGLKKKRPSVVWCYLCRHDSWSCWVILKCRGELNRRQLPCVQTGESTFSWVHVQCLLCKNSRQVNQYTPYFQDALKKHLVREI